MVGTTYLASTVKRANHNVAVAILRVQRRLVAVAAVTVTGAAITTGGAWLLMPHLGITGAGWSALASPVIVATTLAVIWHYRRVRAHRVHRQRFTARRGPALRLSPPRTFRSRRRLRPAADDSPPENTDPSGRS